jgi:acid ceramidase
MTSDHRVEPDLVVDLRRAPADRWHFTPTQLGHARELIRLYTTELGLRTDFSESLTAAVKDLVRPDHWQEMESLSRLLGLPVRDVVLCNCYYDALKSILGQTFGCTAFAVETPGGILHARNLDWWAENGVLERCTATSHFSGAQAGDFTTVGWPGFIGVFSGIAPGRFAISLNAVLSRDPVQVATPVVFLIRAVLEEARSFSDALATLSNAVLPCDCLLLLTGVRAGELVVIERTPSRYALRHAKDGYVCVTNGYLQLDAGLGASHSELLATWCARFERVGALVSRSRPGSSEECFQYLEDPQVRMNITVQHMVFCAATGEHWVRIPGATPAPNSGRVRLPE